MGRTRGIPRRGGGRGRGRPRKTDQEMVFSSDGENGFSPHKEHFTHDPMHAVQDPDAPLKHALPTGLLTYKHRGRKGSSSHHGTLIDEEIDDLQEIDDALCCVTEGEKVPEEPASGSQLPIRKVASPLNETTGKSTSSDSSKSVHGSSMIRCSNRSGDMQMSAPMDLSEDLMAAALSCHVKQKRGPNCSSTFNLTEIAMDDDEDGVESSFGPASVDVKGYRVRPEIAPILHEIFEQHGDIAKDCKLVKVLQGCLLEKVCHVYEKLHNSSCNEIQRNELFEMEATISGLENLGFNLEWLCKKLDEILEVKLFLNVFAKKKRELKKASDQLATLRRTMAPIEQKQADLEEELKKMKNISTIQKVRNLYCNPRV